MCISFLVAIEGMITGRNSQCIIFVCNDVIPGTPRQCRENEPLTPYGRCIRLPFKRARGSSPRRGEDERQVRHLGRNHASIASPCLASLPMKMGLPCKGSFSFKNLRFVPTWTRQNLDRGCSLPPRRGSGQNGTAKC